MLMKFKSNVRPQIIRLSDNSKMAVRSIPVVVRVQYLIASSDPENFYSLLIQYVPYQSEVELLEGFDNAKVTFLPRGNQLKAMSKHMR